MVNELRIGNWFKGGWGEGSYLQVISAYFSAWGENYGSFPKPEPIQLTPDILEKCGFEFKNQLWWHVEESYFGRLEFVGYHCQFVNAKNIGRPFQYLHQLQNIYFALTGTELIVHL